MLTFQVLASHYRGAAADAQKNSDMCSAKFRKDAELETTWRTFANASASELTAGGLERSHKHRIR
ncbi:MAG: hypothetical protein NVS9B15_16350 [Acidobacteriaceae bacterium]